MSVRPAEQGSEEQRAPHGQSFDPETNVQCDLSNCDYNYDMMLSANPISTNIITADHRI